MKARKKPVEIDCLKWTGKNHREMNDFLLGNPDDFLKTRGEHFEIDHTRVEGGLIIKTLEGEHIASIGDYIIKGIKGEYYPCKPDIFLATYDTVEGNGNPTWREMKDFVNRLEDKQLSKEITWWGEERGGKVNTLMVLDEDYGNISGEGQEPRSVYEENMEEGDDPFEVDFEKGTPIIYVD